MKTFPKVIHVLIEEPDRDEPYLAIADGGIFDVQEDGRKIAVYKLETIGKVSIKKKLVTKKGPRSTR